MAGNFYQHGAKTGIGPSIPLLSKERIEAPTFPSSGPSGFAASLKRMRVSDLGFRIADWFAV